MLALRWGQSVENCLGLLVGTLIESADGGAAAGGEGEIGGAPVVAGGGAGDEAGAFELAEDAAEVAGVEAEGFGDLLGLWSGPAGGEFVENTALGERVFGAEIVVVEGAEKAGVGAVEAAEGGGGRGGGRGRRRHEEGCSELVDFVN